MNKTFLQIHQTFFIFLLILTFEADPTAPSCLLARKLHLLKIKIIATIKIQDILGVVS